jgi:hypothetical protein
MIPDYEDLDVFETSVSFIHLTRLIAREEFIESCRRESFRSYSVRIRFATLYKSACT